MFCEECGTKNKDDANFCISCGTTITIIENIPVLEDSVNPVIAKSAQAKLKPNGEDVRRAVLISWVYGFFVGLFLTLVMIYQFFSGTSETYSLYRVLVNFCNSSLPFCSSMGHLGKAASLENENLFAYMPFVALMFWCLGFVVAFPFAYSKVAADRRCKACGTKWAVFFTGNSDFLHEFNHTANERETEKEYRGEHTYKRDIFYTCVYLVSVYDDHYKCISCNDMTKRKRNERQLLEKTVASVGGWISVK